MREENGKKGRTLRRVLPVLAALTAAGWLGNRVIVTNEYFLQSAALPAAFSALRVVQLSDLHGMQFGKENERLLAAVRRARPELIAITGDLADEYTSLPALEPFLSALTAIAPVFYVTGNHEWVMGRAARKTLFSMLDAAGVTRLQNEYRVLSRGEARIVLAGVDDPNGPADQKTPEALVRQIREKEGEGCYILMLAHRNDQLARWAALGVDTVLAGHAHGGIVRLPLIGPVFGTHYELFPDDAEGVYRSGATTLLVSRGLGPSHRIPFRVCNPPELAVAVLTGAET